MGRTLTIPLGGPGEPIERTFSIKLTEGEATVLVTGCPCRVDDFCLVAPSQAKGSTQSAFFAWAVGWKKQAEARAPVDAAPKPCGCKDEA